MGITKSVATEIANQVIGAATSYYINNSNSLSGFKFDVDSLDYKAISIAAGEGVVNGLNPSNWVKYTYKGGKVIFNSANDANIGLTEDKNKGTISFFDMFDSKNEKYAKDFFSSLIFNALDEFILDDLQDNFSKDLSNKEVKQEIIRFMVEKGDDVLFEVMDEVLDKTIGGNTDKIKQSGSVD